MGSELVLVAVGVDANKEISTDYALEWTVQNVIKAEDFLILLAVLPSSQRPTPNLNRRRGKRHNEGNSFGHVDQHKRDISRQINNVYVNKMQQLRLASNLMQVHYEVKVIFDAHLGSVATKSKELKASWVILDRLLKKEADHCIKQLNCNVVLIDDAIPRILKAVNPLAGENSSESMNQSKPTGRGMLNVIPNIMDYKNATTPSSSDIKTSTFGTYSFSMPSTDKEYKCETKTNRSTINNSHAFLHLNSEYFDEDFEYLETFNLSPPDFKSKHLNKISSLHINELNHKSHTSPLHGEAENSSDILRTENSDRKHHFERTDRVPTLARRLTDSSCIWRGPDRPVQPNLLITRRDSMASSNKHESEPSSSVTADGNSIVRKAISLSITSPPAPPAHCSICKKQKTPIFRNAPRKFTYREIEKATDGFLDTNFMTEGGYGCLYRGKLHDGQVIAVKQFKKLKAVAVSEFCLEVETLGCLQHRNLLMLVGYCIDKKWLLIYEFACNGSLGKHLYGTKTNQVMGWHYRMKIAIGTARGLRYFHEDCRAGCIVHRDLRPSNILLTHDFEPMIGCFGLASWQLNAELAEETHVTGTFGYLAPEYIQIGQVTEKVDVYAFGVILLELLSGFRAMEWGSTMLEKKKIKELIDCRLNNNYVEREAECMMHAAYLCISHHPEQRPRMSQVLKILEGDLPMDGASIYQSSTIFNNGSIKRTTDHKKLSQNSKTNLHVKSDLDSASNPPRCLSQIEESEISWEFESAAGLDYESYLRGSLAKFVQNFN